MVYTYVYNVYIYICIVGGLATPLRNMNVSWDEEIPNLWKNEKVRNHQPDIYIY